MSQNPISIRGGGRNPRGRATLSSGLYDVPEPLENVPPSVETALPQGSIGRASFEQFVNEHCRQMVQEASVEYETKLISLQQENASCEQQLQQTRTDLGTAQSLLETQRRDHLRQRTLAEEELTDAIAAQKKAEDASRDYASRVAAAETELTRLRTQLGEATGPRTRTKPQQTDVQLIETNQRLRDQVTRLEKEVARILDENALLKARRPTSATPSKDNDQEELLRKCGEMYGDTQLAIAEQNAQLSQDRANLAEELAALEQRRTEIARSRQIMADAREQIRAVNAGEQLKLDERREELDQLDRNLHQRSMDVAAREALVGGLELRWQDIQRLLTRLGVVIAALLTKMQAQEVRHREQLEAVSTQTREQLEAVSAQTREQLEAVRAQTREQLEAARTQEARAREDLKAMQAQTREQLETQEVQHRERLEAIQAQYSGGLEAQEAQHRRELEALGAATAQCKGQLERYREEREQATAQRETCEQNRETCEQNRETEAGQRRDLAALVAQLQSARLEDIEARTQLQAHIASLQAARSAGASVESRFTSAQFLAPVIEAATEEVLGDAARKIFLRSLRHPS